jgi:hypothetical protein
MAARRLLGGVVRGSPECRDRGARNSGGSEAMTGRKIKLEDRWKYRVAPAPKHRVELAPTEEAAPAPPEEVASGPAPVYAPAPVVDEERARLDQARVDKWIRDRLIDWPSTSCLHCRRPIIVGQLWTIVGNGDCAARFHEPCLAEWLEVQEVAARLALGLASRSASGLKTLQSEVTAAMGIVEPSKNEALR